MPVIFPGLTFPDLASPPSTTALGASGKPYSILQLGNLASINDTANRILRVHQTSTLLAGDLQNSIWSDSYYTPASDADNGSIGGINLDASILGSHSTTGTVYGLSVGAWHSGTGSITSLSGTISLNNVTSTGTVGFIEGHGLSFTTAAGSTVTDGIYGLSFDNITMAGNVGTYYGLWANTPSHPSGTLGAYYSIYISDHSSVGASGNNFAFYYGGGKFAVAATGAVTSLSTVTATDFLGGNWQGKTLTLSGNLTTTGAFNPTFAIPSSSTWTFPSGGGTLLTTAGAGTSLTFPGSLSIASGKTLTASKSLTLDGTDSTTMTFPTTSATIARTDAGQTFSGEQILAHGTITTALSPLTITETRNASGTTFPGVVFNVTDTASASGSLWLDMQLAGVSQLRVNKAGGIILQNAASVNNLLKIGNTNNAIISYESNSLGQHYSFIGDTTGSGGGTQLKLGGAATITWQSTNRSDSGTTDTIIGRGGAAATLQMGADVNGAAVSQTVQAANGITGTDKTGGNLTVASGKGTGAGAVSSLIFQTPAVLGSGTTAQSLATRLTLTEALATFVPAVKGSGGFQSSDGTAGATAGPFTTITSITVKNGLVTALTGA